MHPALQRLLTETLSHYAFTGHDAYGKPVYGPEQQHPARVEFRIRKVVDMTGVERVSRARVFFDGDVVLDLRDKVVLTDGTAPPIIVAYSPRDIHGARDHWAQRMRSTIEVVESPGTSGARAIWPP